LHHRHWQAAFEIDILAKAAMHWNQLYLASFRQDLEFLQLAEPAVQAKALELRDLK